MIGLINKLLKKIKYSNLYDDEFRRLRESSKIDRIFKSISDFSDKSEVRYVGGCVRKIISKEKIDDIDLAANIEPKKIIESLKKNKIDYYESGISHGTVTAKINKHKFEITSLRKDVSTDGRHAVVKFSDNWYEDASRRDFTFNSIYADLFGNLYDPFNGKKDLENGEIKFIGEPEKRIKEDYLRILRYVRFFLNYSDLEHDDKVKRVIRQNINGLTKISTGRLFDELKKLLLSDGFIKIYKDPFSLEIINLVFPQLKNIHLLENLNSYKKEIIEDKDFIFLISSMIIDETDNCEYFLYKFNISNKDKERIRFINSIFSKPLDKNFFKEKNLWRILYFKNKNILNDLINFQIFRSKSIDKKLLKLKNFFDNQSPPRFDIKAEKLMEKFKLKEGRELGQKLKEIEKAWIDNSFKISDKEIEKIIDS